MLLIEKKGTEITAIYNWNIQAESPVYILDTETGEIIEKQLNKLTGKKLSSLLKDRIK